MMETTADGRWIVTNLDGTQHRHVKSGPTAYRPTPTTQTQPTSFLPDQVKQAQQEERNKAIIQAHDENITASKNQTEAVKELTNAILILAQEIRNRKETEEYQNGGV